MSVSNNGGCCSSNSLPHLWQRWWLTSLSFTYPHNKTSQWVTSG